MTDNIKRIAEKILSDNIRDGYAVENANGTFSHDDPDEASADPTELDRDEMLDDCHAQWAMTSDSCHSILAVFVSGEARATVHDDNDVLSITFEASYVSHGNEPDWLPCFSCGHLDDLAIVTAKARNYIGRARRTVDAYMLRIRIEDALAAV